MELAIKYILEENGEEYPKTHDIEQLIQFADQKNADLFLTEYIRDHSEMFTEWESRTRYTTDYQLAKNKIERALDGVGEYLGLAEQKLFPSSLDGDENKEDKEK